MNAPNCVCAELKILQVAANGILEKIGPLADQLDSAQHALLGACIVLCAVLPEIDRPHGGDLDEAVPAERVQ
ncbi:MAG TPA: hypothetical protein VGK94_08500 [Candidatus Polarisedimenticolia bacterium]